MLAGVKQAATRPFEGDRALVTGASSGIGRQIALDLAVRGAKVLLTGRDGARLEAVQREIRGAGGQAEVHPADLTDDPSRKGLVRALRAELDTLELLVHSAGACSLDTVQDTSPEALDLNWAVNLRAPFLLTGALLPLVVAGRGQVVFVNSGAGLNARPEWGAYAASKHGLKALADSLRGEVAGQGVRVLSVYPGRTATPMQEAVKAREGAAYHPEKLIQPSDVARMTVEALALPRTAQVTEINVRGGA